MQLTTYIAGIPHRKPNLSLLHKGDTVQLEAEPGNPFDPDAIKVLHNSIHLGYIPRMETKDWKKVSTATILAIDPKSKWTEVEIICSL